MSPFDVIKPGTSVAPFDEPALHRFTDSIRALGGPFRHFQFDDSYLAFLRATNGGKPQRYLFNTVNRTDRAIETFFHLANLPRGDPSGVYAVPVAFFQLEERLHGRLIPFAELFGGDMLCFDYGALVDGRASIVVWLHEDCTPRRLRTERVADNFDMLLAMLRERDPSLEFRRTTVSAWHSSGTLPAVRVRTAMDIDPHSIRGPLDEELLDRFENLLCEYSRLGSPEVEIDPTYVSFLRLYDGGIPRRGTIDLTGVGIVRAQEFAHMTTFDLDDPRRPSSLWSLWLVKQYGIAKGLLPFATCDGNRVLCFDYTQMTDKRPAIVLSETTGNMNPNIPGRGANYPVAKDFDAFLNLKWH